MNTTLRSKWMIGFIAMLGIVTLTVAYQRRADPTPADEQSERPSQTFALDDEAEVRPPPPASPTHARPIARRDPPKARPTTSARPNGPRWQPKIKPKTLKPMG